MPGEKTVGVARFPRIKMALINIAKKANQLNINNESFPEEVLSLAIRLETAAAHLKILSSEISGDEADVILRVSASEARSIQKACAEIGVTKSALAPRWLSLANKIKSQITKTPE